jgi:hypothetical protein
LATLLTNHLAQTAAIDFFTVPTATFRILFVIVVRSHERRRVLHFGVTEHPTEEWTMQQMREAAKQKGQNASEEWLMNKSHRQLSDSHRAAGAPS